MKWVWLSLIISMPVLAQDVCFSLKRSLVDIESKFQNSTLKNCRDLKESDIGMTIPEEFKPIFNKLKCTNMGTLDTMLGDMESQLVLMDELEDLRAQAVAGQRTLREATNWSDNEKKLATQFSKDITLAASIQNVLESDKLKKIFEGETKGPAWESKLNAFCKDNAQSPICSMWITYGPSSASKALPVTDFFAFLDELRVLTQNGELPKEKKDNLLSSLKIEKDGVSHDFKTYQNNLGELGLYKSMTDASFKNIDQGQRKLLRLAQIRLPSEKDELSSIKKMMGNLSKTQDMLVVKSTTSMFKELMADNVARQEARIKSRWSSLYKTFNSDSPKCLEPNVNLNACINSEWNNLKSRPGLQQQQSDFFQTLDASSKRLATNRATIERCSREDAIQSFIKQTNIPDECDKNLPKRENIELNRKILLALRSRLATQEDQRLRFRQFGATEYEKRCGQATTFAGSPKCQALPGQVEFGPALMMMADTIPLFLEGMKSKEELSTADCPETLEGEYASICRLLNEAPTDSSGGYTPPRIAPVTPGTDAPTRDRDPIVADAIAGVAGDLANMWAQNRMNRLYQPYRPWQMAPYQAFPYSRPISLSMSDYVMATSTYYGGYGNYYQCSTCGFGTNQAAFNSYWGTGSSLSAPVAGMGGAGLGGTSLSGQVFGGFAKF
ncbi:MAG: hypothetical protein K2P81_08830 [Bacteriovoracaceae bacterium]|nr:hypothetical protein [Bacteriovoracaceae bacterium]